MLRYTLRQLEYFVATASSGSIAAAAQRVHVAQPTISNALAKLERQLETQLFVRHHAQGVSLTPAGRRFVTEARRLLQHAEELQEKPEDSGEALSGTLEIGCYGTVGPQFMPALIAAFSAEHPEVEIKLQEGDQTGLVTGLRSGRFEMALLYDIELPQDLLVTPLATFEPYVLLYRGHRLAKRKQVALRDLAEEPLVLLDVPPSRGYFLGLFREAGLSPRIAFSSPSLEMVRGLVSRGCGVSVLVTRPRGDQSYDGQPLVIRPLADAVQTSALAIAQLGEMRPTRVMAAFLAFCRERFAGQGGDGRPALEN